MPIGDEMLTTLEKTSRTFYLPIVRLPSGLKEAVAAGYLCMRAIDEIEDHETLKNPVKAQLLRAISWVLQAQTTVENFAHHELTAIFKDYVKILPEVTLRLGEWACAAPKFIAPRIWEATGAMADRMSHWAEKGWKIQTPADLDRYTFGVAGAVGLLLCDIWAWFEQAQIDREHAIQFGRGLQAVNILRNRKEDLSRGIDFFPKGWTYDDLQSYARNNLDGFNNYAQSLPRTSFISFVYIPRQLAYATLDAISRGEEKVTRSMVLDIVQQAERL